MVKYHEDGDKGEGLSGHGLGMFDGLLGCVMDGNGEAVTMPFVRGISALGTKNTIQRVGTS